MLRVSWSAIEQLQALLPICAPYASKTLPRGKLRQRRSSGDKRQAKSSTEELRLKVGNEPIVARWSCWSAEAMPLDVTVAFRLSTFGSKPLSSGVERVDGEQKLPKVESPEL